jgi:general secretion pathway protein F
VADTYDRQVNTTVGTLTSILEPVMILFMGGVVLTIVLSVLLPMLQMSQIK